MTENELAIMTDESLEYELVMEEVEDYDFVILGLVIDPRNTHVPVATGAVDGLMLKTLNEKYVLAVVGTMLDMNYWKGTQAQYDALTTEEKEDPTYIRFVTI